MAWLLEEAAPEEILAVAWAMKWLVTGLLFLVAFYGGLDAPTLNYLAD